MNVEFLLDENIPYALIDFLENKGYRAKHLKRIGKTGIKNGEVYKLAEEGKFWIITWDSDFESYRKFIEYNIGGIILLKLSQTKTQYLLNTMKKFLERYKNKLSSKNLVIIEDSGIRIYTAGD